MTPMIDVVFLLLVFFVWTSSFELPEFDLSAAIAAPPIGSAEADAAQPPPEAFDELVIRIVRQGDRSSIQLSGQPVDDLSVLRSRLDAVVSLGVQPPVIIDPDDGVTMDLAISVYDTAVAVGLDRVLFATDAS
ncbi:MAG: biopolymer transporter ExbD [Planctomycetota bacterium]